MISLKTPATSCRRHPIKKHIDISNQMGYYMCMMKTGDKPMTSVSVYLRTLSTDQVRALTALAPVGHVADIVAQAKAELARRGN